jgi:multidrug resistance efflux pump
VAKVEVRARVQGFLDSVNFEPGTEEGRGELLYAIEPQMYQARVASAEADVLAQQARLKKAKLEKERQERIRAHDPGATHRTKTSARREPFPLVGIIWAIVYSLLGQVQPGAFSYVHAEV